MLTCSFSLFKKDITFTEMWLNMEKKEKKRERNNGKHIIVMHLWKLAANVPKSLKAKM